MDGWIVTGCLLKYTSTRRRPRFQSLIYILLCWISTRTHPKVKIMKQTIRQLLHRLPGWNHYYLESWDANDLWDANSSWCWKYLVHGDDTMSPFIIFPCIRRLHIQDTTLLLHRVNTETSFRVSGNIALLLTDQFGMISLRPILTVTEQSGVTSHNNSSPSHLVFAMKCNLWPMLFLMSSFLPLILQFLPLSILNQVWHSLVI